MNVTQNLKFKFKKYLPFIAYTILRKKNPYIVDRMKIFNSLKINVILDVGANVGLYAHNVRHNNFKGKIVSFEPQSEAFNQMQKLAESDNMWITMKYGLGSENKTTQINLSKNSVSSSILDIQSQLTDLAENTAFIGKETIEVKRLDSIIDEFCNSKDNIFVKIDTQGYELEVISGCLDCLERICGFQLELSFLELYKGEKTFLEMVNYMDEIGFKLISIEPGWNDSKTGFGVEVDGIFIKKSLC